MIGRLRCEHSMLEIVSIAQAPDLSVNDPAADSRWLACFPDGERWIGIRRLQTPVRDPLADLLTARELQIVEKVTAGLRNKQIAHQLNISEYTVAAYLKQTCYKLQVRNRTALVTRCSQLRSENA